MEELVDKTAKLETSPACGESGALARARRQRMIRLREREEKGCPSTETPLQHGNERGGGTWVLGKGRGKTLERGRPGREWVVAAKW
jgi:hypothetical protein